MINFPRSFRPSHGSTDPISRPRKRRCSFEPLEARQVLDGTSLVISEFMASNSTTLKDEFREYSDWIEIHNPTEETISVNGWRLTDDAEDLEKWQLPDVTVPAAGFLVVFASGANQSDPESELHSNFKLSSDGEYLGLIQPDGTVSHEYKPDFPNQSNDVSYGLVFGDAGAQPDVLSFFPNSTPGEINQVEAITQSAAEVHFNVERGFFTEPFEVTLSVDNPNAAIRYTTDGTAPTAEHGQLYSDAITIDTTTTLRAASSGDGFLTSQVGTQSYIFLDHVLTQDGTGLPAEWGYFDDQGPRRPARASANYGMDPDIVNHEDYQETIKDDLRSLPTISLVVDPDDLWEFENGLYSNPERKGDDWERPISVEMMDGNGETLLEENAGVRIHGGWARRLSQTKKLSFKLIFRSQYGEPTLDYPWFGEDDQTEFQAIVLRAGFNDSYRDSGSGNNTYTQDQWTRQAQRDMGGYTSRDEYAHLYLNGLYWGVYSPTERMNAEWAASTMGGDPEEWDVINTGGSVIDGNTRSFTNLMRAVDPRRGDIDYENVKSMLDVEDFIDYLIVNQFVGNWDWPHNNWYASRRNVEGEKWRFHSWDAEAAFQRGVVENRVATSGTETGPAKVYSGLRNIPEFQELYANRITKHFSPGGTLSTEANIARLNSLASEIDRAMVGESARWGDGRNDTGRAITQEVWRKRIQSINSNYFAKRSERVLRQFRDANFLPTVDAPIFSQPGGQVDPDKEISLTTDLVDGEIHYTLDGSDPKGSDNQPSESAISLNFQDLVSQDSPARLLAPSGNAQETDWTSTNFDDSSWIRGRTSIGFDTGEIEDLISVSKEFDVREIQSATKLNTVELATQLLEGINVESELEHEPVPYLNFLHGSRGGNFDDNLNFAVNKDNFAMDINGTIRVKESGVYTFLLTSNDAVRLIIDGKVLYVDEERHGTRDKFVTTELSAGDHAVNLFWFDRTGTAVLEFAYAPGEKTLFDDTFTIVGDIKHRPYTELIRTDLQAALLNQTSSAYMRIPFQVANRDEIDNLVLKMQYDDGFVAHLNGTEIARRSSPDSIAFDSAATINRFDVAAISPELIDLSEFMGLLQDGDNMLTIQALNVDKDDTDMFLSPRLMAFDNGKPIDLENSSTVKARVFRDGIWSGMTEADFSVGVPATIDDLRVSEIHYHPRAANKFEAEAGFEDADDFEFIEIVNIGPNTIDLSETRFVTTTIADSQEGVDFSFAGSAITELGPGQRAVVVEDLRAFAFRYGNKLPVAGQWSGQLSNSSEQITLRIGEALVQSFAYSDTWYPESDGPGASLEVISPAETLASRWNSASSWRVSGLDGSPGFARASQPGDANRDGLFDTSDLILIFSANEFEDDIANNSTWEEGDWDRDGDFTTSDLVVAFRFGNFMDSAAASTGVSPQLSPTSVSPPKSALQPSDAELFTALDTSVDARDKLFRDWIDQV